MIGGSDILCSWPLLVLVAMFLIGMAAIGVKRIFARPKGYSFERYLDSLEKEKRDV